LVYDMSVFHQKPVVINDKTIDLEAQFPEFKQRLKHCLANDLLAQSIINLRVISMFLLSNKYNFWIIAPLACTSCYGNGRDEEGLKLAARQALAVVVGNADCSDGDYL
jgi:hypothetical protein